MTLQPDSSSVVNAAGIKSVGLPEVPRTVRIIHTNDIHAHLDEFNKYGTDCTDSQRNASQCYGGAARIQTIVNRLRAEKPGALLFDAGDQFQGTMFYSYYRGNVTAQFMNTLGYDLMTVGNHEFDDGPEHLAKFFAKLNFPIVSANMRLERQPALQPFVKPYQLFPSHKLAVIGFITNTTGYISNAGPTVGFEDAVPAVQRVIDELRQQGYVRIIAVSHNGYVEDQDVARRTSGLDVIVGGHSHTYLSSKPKDPDSKGLYPTKVINLDGDATYVVQAYCWGKYVGHIDVTFDHRGRVTEIQGEPTLLDQSIEEDVKTKSVVKEWRSVFDAFGQVVVGQADTDFPNGKCQDEECPIGDLLTDAMVYARRSDPTIRAAIINAGGIRTGFNQGTIRQADVTAMLPFGNALTDIRLTGKQVKQLLEDIVAKKNQQSEKPITSFIQVSSGLRFSYDPKLPIYQRVYALEIAAIQKSNNNDGDNQTPSEIIYEPVQPDQTYGFVTLDFIVNGGDGFFAQPPNPIVPLMAVDDALKDYIKAKGTIDAKKLFTSKRITIGPQVKLPVLARWKFSS